MTLLMFCSKLILENDVSVLLHIVSKYVGLSHTERDREKEIDQSICLPTYNWWKWLSVLASQQKQSFSLASLKIFG